MNLGWFLHTLPGTPHSREVGGDGELALPVNSSRHSENPKPVYAGLTASQSLPPSHLSLGGLSMREICPRQLNPAEA